MNCLPQCGWVRSLALVECVIKYPLESEHRTSEVWVWKVDHSNVDIYNIYIYMYVCVCVFVSMCKCIGAKEQGASHWVRPRGTIITKWRIDYYLDQVLVESNGWTVCMYVFNVNNVCSMVQCVVFTKDSIRTRNITEVGGLTAIYIYIYIYIIATNVIMWLSTITTNHQPTRCSLCMCMCVFVCSYNNARICQVLQYCKSGCSLLLSRERIRFAVLHCDRSLVCLHNWAFRIGQT